MPNRKKSIVYKNSEAAKAIGKRIMTIRKQLEMTQEDLAIEADIDRVNISNLEAGRFAPTIDLIFVIAKALNVQVKELFDFDTSQY